MQTPLQDISHFQIITVEPNLILMRHKQNRKTYRYVESISPPHSFSSCPYLISPLPLPTGFLYQTGFMTLGTQIQNILKSGQKCSFDQSEILNTIEPIVRALEFIHQQGKIHGALCPDNIILDEFQELKIYYPGIQSTASSYYKNSNQKLEDDYRALAIIVLELLGFQKFPQEQEIKILNNLCGSQKYTRRFLFSLLCMLKKKTQFLSKAVTRLLKEDILSLEERLSSEEKQFYESQIVYEKNKKKEQSQPKRTNQKIQFTPPLVKHADHTPKKNTQTTKKYVKAEDVQNRKYIEESKKKKPSDHALKRVSNGKTQGENSNVSSPNYKKILRDIKETKQRQDLLKMAVTIKRMRTVSKKKIG